MATRIFDLKNERERTAISALLDWATYDPETGLYDLEARGRNGRDIGFCFFCLPAVGASSDMETVLADLFSPTLLPANSIVSVSLLSLPAIQYRLDDWAKVFQHAPERLRYLCKFRSALYSKAWEGNGSMLNAKTIRPFERSVVISVRVPCGLETTPEMRMRFVPNENKGSLGPSQKESEVIESLSNAQIAIMNSLQICGLNPIQVDPALLMAITRQLFGPQQDFHPYIIHPNQLLKDQFFDADDRLAKTKDNKALIVGRKWIASGYSVKRYPSKFAIGMLSNVSGDFFSDIKSIQLPYCMTTHVRIPDNKQAKNDFLRRYRLILKQVQSQLVHWIPELRKKHEEYVEVEDELFMKGESLADVTTTFVLYGRSRKELSTMEKTVMALWEGAGFKMQRESDALLNVVEGNIPMNMSIELFDWIGHRGRVYATNAAQFLPIYGDWKGTGSSGILLMTRRGQIASIDIYETSSNYNFTITAESGKGKTFFANDILASVIARNGKATVFDVGGGFKRTIELNGGEYLTVSPGKGQCFNPLTDMPIVNGEIDPASGEKELAIDMFSLMACGAREITQDEKGHLERAIDEAIRREGNDADALLVRRMLEESQAEIPECGRLAHGLYPFTEGRYREFFCGRSNVAMNWDLGGIEFQELANMPDLRLVVLAMALNRSTNQMYLSDRSIPKILLCDEAWDVLGAESADTTSASRTLSGVTRKARKHYGATGFITQNVMDWFGNKSMEAIFSTSEWMFLLGQRDENIERFLDEKKITMTEFEAKMMRSVDTVRGQYSEIMVRMASSGVSEVMRLIVDPYSYAMQTSDAREAPAIDRLIEQGMPIEVACAMFALQSESFKDRAEHLGLRDVITNWEREQPGESGKKYA